VKLPAYLRTKPSGIEWLGDVPEHWEVRRSDATVSADRSQLSPEKFADLDVFHYSIPVVQETGTGQVENGESIASAKQVIKKPVVLVSKLNPRKATICLAKPQAILTLCSTEFVALNADQCELAFLEYLTRSELFRQGLDSKVQSVTRSHQRANPADIYKFWNAWPTLEEQRSIAAFLDRETGRVDRLVAKKQELIERLKEKRTALVSRTVTRGLPPAAARVARLPANPPLKPSTLEWLGDIPKHWEIKQLKHLGVIASGYAFNSSDFCSSGVRVLKIANVQTLRLDWSDESYLPEEFYVQHLGFVVQDGDVVFALTRPIISTGLKAAIAKIGDERILLNQRNALFRPRQEVHRHFIYHALFSVSFKAAFETQIDFTGQQPNISPIDIENIKIPVPSLPEQAAITAYLDEETSKLDELVAKVEEAVERLQEYRTALITAAVTGKIDVRNAVAP
jgi:type I restriction enzyme S subunit